VGSAVDTLPTLEGPFDVVFIDADKGNYPTYLEEAIRLTRPGGLIIGDNVIRRGRVVDPVEEDDVAMDRFNRMLASDERLDATILQTVGTKHHDGVAIAVRR
ncbi:MAG: methyltransferase, partial [Acidimicrobiia bacterium]|nr:methyltransferase [Acidimicrobiia bacterium]